MMSPPKYCLIALILAFLVADSHAKLALARFDRDQATGTILFSQPDPSSLTTVTISFETLPQNAAGYHVHVLPVPSYESGRTNTVGARCGAALGHYDPLGLGGCTSGNSTEMCEIGGLSGRHGNVQMSESYSDPNVPLFGRHSIVGRSIVIHSSIDSSRIACANIHEVTSDRYDPVLPTLVAKFFGDGGIAGTIVMTPASEGSDTSISVNLHKVDDSGATVGHNWHVHSSDVDIVNGVSNCASAQGHFNPLGVCLTEECNYSTFCNENNHTSCELGDLVGKHGSLDFSADPAALVAQYTDEQLPLTGPNGIAGRSIVIHVSDSGGPRLACATLHSVVPRRATSTLSNGQGEVEFSQPFPGFPTTITTRLRFDLQGSITIHSAPVRLPQSGENTCPLTGVLFNPLATQACTGQSGEDDAFVCPIGSLTSKNSLSRSSTVTDSHLPLFGPDSVIGRSLVITDGNGDRVICGTISLEGQTIFQLTSTYNGPDVVGTVSLAQAQGDVLADTLVSTSLSYFNNRATTTGHAWHVHASTVNGTDCGSTGGHYNPLGVCLDTCDYQSRCGPGSQQSFCEVLFSWCPRSLMILLAR